MGQSKLVVIGSVNGHFRQVFEKVSKLHAKNQFALCLVIGNLFANAENSDANDVADLLDGKIEVALPTYFALGNHPLPQAVIEKLDSTDTGELCSNLYFLGKRTTIKTSEDIRIVALGGSLDSNIAVGTSKDKYTPFFTESDAKVLRGANSADILITSQWPEGVQTGSHVPEPQTDALPTRLQCISDLCSTLKPRYHFSVSTDAFYEREPFFHAQEVDSAASGYAVTRFISLAQYDNGSKAKWIYAFSIDPAAARPTVIPPGTTASPFAFSSRKRPALPDQSSSFRFDMGTSQDQSRRNGRSSKRQKPAPPGPQECFFCLSNPQLATHLIASIGSAVYLATAKGPLSTASTFEALGFPCHMLLIPLAHTPTLALVSEPESRAETYEEMVRLRGALNAMLVARAGGALGSVTWEVARAEGVHAHWQFLPVAADLVRRGLVEAAFKVQAENDNYPKMIKKDARDGADDETDFFRLKIWAPATNDSAEDKEKDVNYMLPLDASFRFDLQFGRVVMAKLLGLESRVQWRDCGQTHEDEVGDVEAFKKAFKSWDFTLDD